MSDQTIEDVPGQLMRFLGAQTAESEITRLRKRCREAARHLVEAQVAIAKGMPTEVVEAMIECALQAVADDAGLSLT